MAYCNGCGGWVGRDCYNPIECERLRLDARSPDEELIAHFRSSSIPIDELEAIINYHEAHDDYAIATEMLRVFIQMNVKERAKFINKHKNK